MKMMTGLLPVDRRLGETIRKADGAPMTWKLVIMSATCRKLSLYSELTVRQNLGLTRSLTIICLK